MREGTRANNRWSGSGDSPEGSCSGADSAGDGSPSRERFLEPRTVSGRQAYPRSLCRYGRLRIGGAQSGSRIRRFRRKGSRRGRLPEDQSHGGREEPEPNRPENGCHSGRRFELEATGGPRIRSGIRRSALLQARIDHRTALPVSILVADRRWRFSGGSGSAWSLRAEIGGMDPGAANRQRPRSAHLLPFPQGC